MLLFDKISPPGIFESVMAPSLNIFRTLHKSPVFLLIISLRRLTMTEIKMDHLLFRTILKKSFCILLLFFISNTAGNILSVVPYH